MWRVGKNFAPRSDNSCHLWVAPRGRRTPGRCRVAQNLNGICWTLAPLEQPALRMNPVDGFIFYASPHHTPTHGGHTENSSHGERHMRGVPRGWMRFPGPTSVTMSVTLARKRGGRKSAGQGKFTSLLATRRGRLLVGCISQDCSGARGVFRGDLFWEPGICWASDIYFSIHNAYKACGVAPSPKKGAYSTRGLIRQGVAQEKAAAHLSSKKALRIFAALCTGWVSAHRVRGLHVAMRTQMATQRPAHSHAHARTLALVATHPHTQNE
jgi:hypothetical protein